MTPSISEFSYGFALTNEIVGWEPLQAAPIFPSLIEEGKSGGGYDVKLDMPAIPLFLQFKRSDCMIRPNAREYVSISNAGLSIGRPYYRFGLYTKGTVSQHELLLGLDDGTNLVFYAAPRFHEQSEINEAWTNNDVAQRSVFVQPREIGVLSEGKHTLAFDDNTCYLCSQPKLLEFADGQQLANKLRSALSKEKSTLRDGLPKIKERFESARERATEFAVERELLREYRKFQEKIPGAQPILDDEAIRYKVTEEFNDVATGETLSPRTQVRPSRDLTETETTLRELADQAARSFNTQLIFIQMKT